MFLTFNQERYDEYSREVDTNILHYQYMNRVRSYNPFRRILEGMSRVFAIEGEIPRE